MVIEMDFFTRLIQASKDTNEETLATRRSELIEFGEDTSDGSEVHEFEVCKGLICTLD